MIKKLSLAAVLLSGGLIQAMESAPTAGAGSARSASQGSPRAPRQEVFGNVATDEQKARELLRLTRAFILENEVFGLERLGDLLVDGVNPGILFPRGCSEEACREDHGSYSCLSMLCDFENNMRWFVRIRHNSLKKVSGETEWNEGFVADLARKNQVSSDKIIGLLQFLENALAQGAWERLLQVKQLFKSHGYVYEEPVEAESATDENNPPSNYGFGNGGNNPDSPRNNLGGPRNNTPSRKGGWGNWFSYRKAAAVIGVVIVAAIGKKYFYDKEDKK